MSQSIDYDLMTIGGGSAAFSAAIKAAELGARVAIVEKGTIGGTCVNIGCVPSKMLIKAAELCYHSAYPQFEGLTACPPPSDWQRVVSRRMNWSRPYARASTLTSPPYIPPSRSSVVKLNSWADAGYASPAPSISRRRSLSRPAPHPGPHRYPVCKKPVSSTVSRPSAWTLCRLR